MKNHVKRTALAWALLASTAPWFAGLAAAAPYPGAAEPPSGFTAEYLRQLDDVEKKIVALAEAVPADKYAWRPAEGVRSVGEVWVHLTEANFFIPGFWDHKPAEAIDLAGLEKVAGDKAKVVDALKKSIGNVRRAAQAATPADLDRKVKIFGQDRTIRDGLLTLANHMHEHLGQSIAYARMNKVTPPWSQ